MRPLAKISRPGRAKWLIVNRQAVSDLLGEGGYFDGFYPAWTSSTYGANRESIDETFAGYISGAYKANGIVFACILARMLPFSEARFQVQEILDGRPGRLSNNESLDLLSNPWPNGTTGELLSRMEQDASLAGNCYLTTVGNGASRRIRRLRPDAVTIVSGVRGQPDVSPFALDAEILGYIYDPRDGKTAPVLLTPDRVVHYSPIPDPDAQWRGMSWLTPLLPEIKADTQATRHKLKYFENGATGGLVISYDKTINPSAFQRYVEMFEEAHRGTDNAYKTIHLGGGADPKVMSADLKQLDFKSTQGAGETRIAAAAGVGAIIARFSEGLAGSSLNSGNYSAAKRQFADMTLRPLWRTAAAALTKLVDVPTGSRLWYDVRDVEFLKEDRKDAAEILGMTASTIKSLVDAGYDPDKVIDAVEADDLSRLVGAHSGLFSVQLQPAGSATSQGVEVLPLDRQVEAAGALVRAGYEPAGALAAVGLDPIEHLGLLPVTLQSTRQLELTPGEADAVTSA